MRRVTHQHFINTNILKVLACYHARSINGPCRRSVFTIPVFSVEPSTFKRFCNENEVSFLSTDWFYNPHQFQIYLRRKWRKELVEQSWVMSHIQLPSKSTLAASTIPAMVYLGYVLMTKTGDKTDRNNNNNKVSSSCSTSNFNTELQEKLFKVQRSRLDPIEEEPLRERDYWKC